MRKVNSGEGATALNVDIDKVHPELTTGTSGLPPHPEEPWPHHQTMSFWPTDPALARRVADLEERVKALEDRE